MDETLLAIGVVVLCVLAAAVVALAIDLWRHHP